MSGIFSVAARMKQLVTTPTVPPSGQSILYFKGDGLPYCIGPDGIEHPLVETPSSLHLNPSFDQITALVPGNQVPNGSFDTNITGWIAGANATIARVTTPVQAGAGALSLTATAGVSAIYAGTLDGTSGIAVTPGQGVTATAYVQSAAATSANNSLQCVFFDSSGASLGLVEAAYLATTTTYAQRQLNTVVPTSAAYMAVRCVVGPVANGEVFYFDTVNLTLGGRPLNWDAFWVTAPAVLTSDNTAGNFVAGYSAKLSPLTSTGDAGTGYLSEQTTHNCNDQQAINFAIWCKTDVPSASSPVLTVTHMTAVLQADCGVLNPNAISTNRTFAPTNTWTRYAMSFGVPPGHLYGRFLLRLQWTGAVTNRNVWFDESSSEAVQAAAGSTVPIGSVEMWPVTAPPDGWLVCDGSSKLITDYPVLSALIRTTYGGVDSTHFNLPDMKNRLPMGVGTKTAAGGTEGGATEAQRATRFDHRHTHNGASHSHSVTVTADAAHVHGVDIAVATNTTASGGASRITQVNGGSATGTFNTDPGSSHNHAGSSAPAGAVGTTGEGALAGSIVEHPFLGLNFIIRAL